MSDNPHTEHDEYDADDAGHEVYCGCDDAPRPIPRRRTLILHALAVLALLVGCWTMAYLAGSIVFAQGWGVILGVITLLTVSFAFKTWPASILAYLAALVAVSYWGTERFADAFSTGSMSLATLALGAFLVGTVSRWRDAGYDFSLRDPVKAEADAGLKSLDSFLTYSATTMGKHTTAQMRNKDLRRMIALSGYAGAGKDTAAAALIFDKDYTRVAFADKLRAFALAVDDEVVIWPSEPFYDLFKIEDGRPVIMALSQILRGLEGDWTEAKKIPAIRRRLQRIGTDAGRKVLGENVWVDAVMADLPDGPLVFTDTRFPNEAKAISDAGGYVVRVTRPGVDAVNAHVSETALDDWDFDGAVINDDTPAAAREQMRNVEEVLYDA